MEQLKVLLIGHHNASVKRLGPKQNREYTNVTQCTPCSDPLYNTWLTLLDPITNKDSNTFGDHKWVVMNLLKKHLSLKMIFGITRSKMYSHNPVRASNSCNQVL